VKAVEAASGVGSRGTLGCLLGPAPPGNEDDSILGNGLYRGVS